MKKTKAKGQRSNRPGEITYFLHCWEAREDGALNQLISRSIPDLGRIASSLLNRENLSPGLLQPQELVNEAFLRLARRKPVRLKNRLQFFWFVGHLMGQILIDRARTQKAKKRGGEYLEVSRSLIKELPKIQEKEVTFSLSVKEGLLQLNQIDNRQAGMTILRFYYGMSTREIARIFGVSSATVEREWRTARHWLNHFLGKRELE